MHEEHDERAKLEWLRTAVQEGVDAIDRGDYTDLTSELDIQTVLRHAHEQASLESQSPQHRD